MKSSEFVEMTMAFADAMSLARWRGSADDYTAAREELRKHLADSEAAIGMLAYCKGLKVGAGGRELPRGAAGLWT